MEQCKSCLTYDARTTHINGIRICWECLVAELADLINETSSQDRQREGFYGRVLVALSQQVNV